MGLRPRAAVTLIIGALLVPSAVSAASNDPRFPQQWGLHRVGAEFAWTSATGGGVLIAVIDTGVDLSHEDLKSQLVPGADFVAGDGDPSDEHGHGTLVAGVAAAATNNSKGIASVAPAAQILPVRAINQDGVGEPEDVRQAIDYSVGRAKELGRKLIINLSLDGLNDQGSHPAPVPLPLADPRVDSAIKSAADAGAAVIIAAGNTGQASTSYDADRPGILVVGASDRNDGRWQFSSYGPGLDLLAPGVDVISTWWSREHGPNVYGSASGTSISVPFVSGTASLLMSKGMSSTQAADRILKTARDLGTPGRDNEHGWGLLDTAAALGVPRIEPTTQAPSGSARSSGGSRPRTQATAPAPAPEAPVESPSPLPVPENSNPPPELAVEVVVSPPEGEAAPAINYGSVFLLLLAAAGHILRRFKPGVIGLR